MQISRRACFIGVPGHPCRERGLFYRRLVPCLPFLPRQTLSISPKQAAEQIAADTADAFGFALVAVEARGGEDAIGKAGERKTLEIHQPRPRQLGEKQTFSSKERVPEAADKLDVVVNRISEGGKAAGIDPERLAGPQFAFDDGAACVNKGQPPPLLGAAR